MSESGERLIKLAAERAAERRNHLAWVFAQYMASQAISLPALAAELGCSEAVMPRLALCLRPRSNWFADDVTAIAAEFAAESAVLARIVRHVDALEAMAVGTKTKNGVLMAARKRRTRKGD